MEENPRKFYNAGSNYYFSNGMAGTKDPVFFAGIDLDGVFPYR